MILTKWKGMSDMEINRNYFIEEAKTQNILFRGTHDECYEWCVEHAEEYEDKILIIRKGADGRNN